MTGACRACPGYASLPSETAVIVWMPTQFAAIAEAFTAVVKGMNRADRAQFFKTKEPRHHGGCLQRRQGRRSSGLG